MRPYGLKRCETPACRYNCCSCGTYSKRTGYRVKSYVIQTQRKRARQQGKNEVNAYMM